MIYNQLQFIIYLHIGIVDKNITIFRRIKKGGNMEFYERLENTLKSRNITIYKMCKDLKISTNTIGNY